jgi:hypothetical protein
MIGNDPTGRAYESARLATGRDPRQVAGAELCVSLSHPKARARLDGVRRRESDGEAVRVGGLHPAGEIDDAQ